MTIDTITQICLDLGIEANYRIQHPNVYILFPYRGENSIKFWTRHQEHKVREILASYNINDVVFYDWDKEEDNIHEAFIKISYESIFF